MKLKNELNKKIIPVIEKLTEIETILDSIYDLFDNEIEELNECSGVLKELNGLTSIADLIDITTNEVCLCRDKIEWFIKENGGIGVDI